MIIFKVSVLEDFDNVDFDGFKIISETDEKFCWTGEEMKNLIEFYIIKLLSREPYLGDDHAVRD